MTIVESEETPLELESAEGEPPEDKPLGAFTRSSYAGSFFELYPNAQEIADGGGYLDLSQNDYARGTLEAWLRNSPKEKPNAQPRQARGMPNLNLNEAQIDLLVDYLMTLN